MPYQYMFGPDFSVLVGRLERDPGERDGQDLCRVFRCGTPVKKYQMLTNYIKQHKLDLHEDCLYFFSW